MHQLETGHRMFTVLDVLFHSAAPRPSSVPGLPIRVRLPQKIRRKLGFNFCAAAVQFHSDISKLAVIYMLTLMPFYPLSTQAPRTRFLHRRRILL